MGKNDTEQSVTWEYGPIEQQHIRDANRADDCPEDLTFEVANGRVTATGTVESIRWLYDYLIYLQRAWRNEGEQWDADSAEEMADSLYEQVEGDLPDRQRPKQAMTDGGSGSDGTEHVRVVLRTTYQARVDVPKHVVEDEDVPPDAYPQIGVVVEHNPVEEWDVELATDDGGEADA